MGIYEKIFCGCNKRIAALVDPDKFDPNNVCQFIKKVDDLGADMFFVGGSIVNTSVFDTISIIKSYSSLPVIIFPGSPSQFSKNADAMLVLSLISGRNPEYLIGAHVQSAVAIKRSKIETIPTGYILIDGGCPTSVQYVSNTMPIPSNKPDIAVATALAGELLGMKVIYLEAGSGAAQPVSNQIISQVKNAVNLPLIVGGGLRSKKAIENAFASGADIVVVGTALENNNNIS